MEGERSSGEAKLAKCTDGIGGSPFDALLRDASAAPAVATTGAADALHVCRLCRSELVQLERCREISGTEYEVVLRCPECGVREELEVPEPLVLAFDAWAEAGEDTLRALLRVVTRARVAGEVDAFRRALDEPTA